MNSCKLDTERRRGVNELILWFKKLRFVYAQRAFLFIFCILLASCAKKQVVYDFENDFLVEAVTETNISRLQPIMISFKKEITCPIEEAISLLPKQKGEWKLVTERTAVFTPSKEYKANSVITLKADCKKLFGEDGISGFYQHPFLVSPPSYKVQLAGFLLDSGENAYSLEGNVQTDVPVVEKIVKKIINANFGLKKLSVDWLQTADKNVWQFIVRGIKATNHSEEFNVSWNGSPLGLSKADDKAYSGSKTYAIPAKNVFKIVDVNTTIENTVLVSFSKTLDSSQNINDFVVAFNDDGRKVGNVNATIKGNIITIYNDANWKDIAKLTVAEGVQSENGDALYAKNTITLNENWEVPEVRFMSKGNILPTSQGTVVALETRNLTGLIIQAYQIDADNILQFLQVNELDGANELYRVGEPVWQKAVDFEWDNSMQNKFVPRGIDISELVKKYSSGLFQIRVSFRKKNTRYICRKTHDDFSKFLMPPDDLIEDSKYDDKYWNWMNKISWDERRTYWQYQDDPCNPAFYMKNYNANSLLKKNVIISDIGLMAKKTQTNKLAITAANLKTAKPISGLQIDAYNFVGKKLETAKTSSDGNAIFENADKIFVVVADDGSQKSYLKISSATTLNVSHFETGGEKASRGVKGVIYSERGVHRPGDKIYLTFVLQDLNKTLPKNIPVNFELTDPLGRVADSRVLIESVDGFYALETKTQNTAVTGLWNAKIKIGSNEWNKPLRVEAIIPNKLEVNLTADKAILDAKQNYFTLSGKWLHGAPTPNYKATVSMRFSEMETKFSGYSDYTFTNPFPFKDTQNETIFDGYLDASSKVVFPRRLDAGRDIPGKLKATFTSKIFEPSGAFSTAIKSFEYSPYDKYIGIKLQKEEGEENREIYYTDKKHKVDVAFLTQNGEAVLAGNLDYEIYKLDWKWWWEKDAYTSATYISSKYMKKIESGSVEIKNGKGSFEFQIPHSSWGRYLVQVKNGSYGHTAGKIIYVDWQDWNYRATDKDAGSSVMVALSADKKEYKVGEKAKVSFASMKGQRALATIEKSGEILSQRWIETTAESTTFDFLTTKEMTPNVYVHLTLLQEHLQTQNSLPIRLYGVVPVMVSDDATKLEPVITANESFRPGEKTSISVSEKSGKEMTYTIAVVDEGLLNLTGFKAVRLRDEFYKKEASLLESFDLYSYVMNAYSGKLETLLAVGGSEEIINDGGKDTNRFAPVVKFFGPYTLKAGEKKATTFEMPQYVGAVRTMVVAGHNGAYGTAEKTTQVKSELMIQASVPRTIGFGESIKVAATVFNGEDREKVVRVGFRIQGLGSSSQGSGSDSQGGGVGSQGGEGEVKTVTLPAFGNETLKWTVASDKWQVSGEKQKAVDSGQGTVDSAGAEQGAVAPAEAVQGGVDSYRTSSLAMTTARNDEQAVRFVFVAEEQKAVDSGQGTVNSAGAEQGAVAPAEAKQGGVDSYGDSRLAMTAEAKTAVTVPIKSRGIPVHYRTRFELKPGYDSHETVHSPGEIETTKVSLELSLLPIINLNERLEYLIQYPHGCIEQITSGAFPQLYVGDFIKLSPSKIEKTKENIQSVIERYSEYQMVDGAFSYWPGSENPSEWGSAWAAHFMTEAKKKGYNVPDTIYEPLLDWLEESATAWSYSKDNYWQAETQGYTLYVLALAGKANVAAMNRLDSVPKLPSRARIFLSAAYALSGRKEISNKILQETKFENNFYRSNDRAYGSYFREAASILMVYNLLDDTYMTAKFAKIVAENLGSDRWMSTQDVAWSLISLLPYYKDKNDSSSTYEFTSAGEKFSGNVDGTAVFDDLKVTADENQAIDIKNTGKKLLYGVLTASGMSRPGTEVRQNEGLSLDVGYKNDKGQVVNYENLRAGDTFTIEVVLKNWTEKRLENIALTVPLATCWEINNDRIVDIGGSGRNTSGGSGGRNTSGGHGRASVDYQDIRDDAIYTYLSLDKNEEQRFSFSATITYEGNYYIPAVHAETMYDDANSAIWPGRFVAGE